MEWRAKDKNLESNVSWIFQNTAGYLQITSPKRYMYCNLFNDVFVRFLIEINKQTDRIVDGLRTATNVMKLSSSKFIT
jgi:hypothetical protein